MSIKIFVLILAGLSTAVLLGCLSRADSNVAPNSSSVATTTPAQPQVGSIDMQAGVVMKSGDVKPIAREGFLLLDRDAFLILAEAGFKDKKGNPVSGAYLLLARVNAEIDQMFDKKTPSEFARMMAVLKNTAVQEATSDFSGKAQFSQVTAGDYWIFGLAEIGDSGVVWNFKNQVKAGNNSVLLDQKNAVVAQ